MIPCMAPPVNEWSSSLIFILIKGKEAEMVKYKYPGAFIRMFL
jgi:hypothetical protein